MLPAVIAGTVARTAATGAASGGIAGAFTGSSAASNAIAGLAGSIGNLERVGQAATHSVTQLAGAVTGKLGQALTMWIGFVEQAAKPIESLVRVANPAIANAFGRAVSDAYGVVGRMLIPIMNAFTGVARKVGDVMAALEPTFQPAINAIAKLVEVIGNEFVKAAREHAPVFEAMAEVITRVAEAASTAAKVLGFLVRTFNNVFQMIARIAGFTGRSMDNNRSAVGAAAREARFVQPKQLSDEMIRNSLMMGVGQEQQKTPEQALNSIDKIAGKILKFLEENKPPRNLKEAGQQLTGGTGLIGNNLGEVSPLYRLFRYAMARGG